MIVHTVNGDLVDMALTAMRRNDRAWFAHGANCMQTMETAGGIAKQIADRIPAVSEVDKIASPKLGEFSAYSDAESAFFNLYTQEVGGADARYDAVYDCFKRLNQHYKSTKYLRWAGGMNQTPDMLFIPMIGCGIGGLRWNIVELIINDAAPDMPITLVKYEG